MSISESDWQKFKVLRVLALERFYLGVLADAKTISERETLSAEARLASPGIAITMSSECLISTVVRKPARALRK